MTEDTTNKPDSPSPRVARRQERTRRSILDAATEAFAEKNIAAVSVEEIIEAADVSRGTFYKHFKHKEEVLTEIMRPLMEAYGERLAAIQTSDPMEIIDEVIAVYIDIWRSAPAAFSLTQEASKEVFHLLADAHRPVMTNMRRLFKTIEPYGILRAGSAENAVALMARSAVVILRVFDGKPGWEQLFSDSLRGLLLTEDYPAMTLPITRSA